jgi:hypothetical protein
MTGSELYAILFEKHGDLSKFARYAGVERQVMKSRFKVKNVNVDILRKYAAWKGLNEAEFITWAQGLSGRPVTEPITVTEPMAQYNSGQNNDQRLISTLHQTDNTMTMEVILKMLDGQAQQNAALVKLANAAEINAITIAKLHGLSESDILGKRKVS